MLAIVLALASAIGYGSSDFAAGIASRRAGVIQVTLLASLISTAAVAVALPFAGGHPPSATALAWGAEPAWAAPWAGWHCTSGSGRRRSVWPGR